MSLIVAWILLPLFLALIGATWGFLVERAAGAPVHEALLLPLGLAAVLVVAGTLNAFTATAPLALPLVALGTLAGLPLVWAGRGRLKGWPLIAAAGALLVLGAPVLLSGEATFAGYIRLDDTAVWLLLMDHLPTGPDAAAGELPSTYWLEYNTALGPHYPRGAFILPGVASDLMGIDVAWSFQPYLAACAAALALSLYALIEPLVPSARIRALVVFLAAQPALLYGYSLWGGIKELTAAFLLALLAACVAAIVRRPPVGPRGLIPAALAAGALVQTLGVGAGGWVALAFALLAASWLWLGWRAKKLLSSAMSIVSLGALTAACIVPVWISLSDFLANDAGLFSSGQDEQTKLGNLTGPLDAFQLAGIWPEGDFRDAASGLPTVLLIGLVFAAAAVAVVLCVKRREWGLLIYAAVALLGCGLIYKAGATPWVVGKTMAIVSPALLLAALAGGAMLWSMHRAGALVVVALAFGVLWSTALAYHDAVLAPRERLAELQHVGTLVDGKPQTLFNEYEIYGTYHFLRKGAPIGPADYRAISLPLRDGTTLTATAWADLDSFSLPTLQNYRSIVTRRSPAESRPPSDYRLTWQGNYYSLWQRPESPDEVVLAHVPLGESLKHPYCGQAQFVAAKPECSVNPVATPPCERILRLGRRAGRMGGRLVAHQRAEPIVARADETLWPEPWLYDPEAHSLTPVSPGELVSRIGVSTSQRYELWLGGSFARGLQVSVDGVDLGTVENELSSIGGYAPVAEVWLPAGVHTFSLVYPDSDLTPGSGDNSFTSLAAISLQPHNPRSELVEVAAERARELCGRPLDWVEIVAR